MILDIKLDTGWKQFKHVRLTTVYLKPDDDAKPELVIHFHDYLYPMMSIALGRIEQVVVTND